GIEIALGDRLYSLFFGSLNTQEVGMRVQSIRTAIQVRDPGRNGFLCAAIEMSLGKVDAVAEGDHVAQEVGAVAEALEDPRHALAARLGAPLVIHSGHFTGGIAVFDDRNLELVFRHGRKGNFRWAEL